MKRIPTSFALTEDDKLLLEKASEKDKRSQSNLVAKAIAEYAEKLGIVRGD